jgi:hypothetical protein
MCVQGRHGVLNAEERQLLLNPRSAWTTLLNAPCLPDFGRNQ